MPPRASINRILFWIFLAFSGAFFALLPTAQIDRECVVSAVACIILIVLSFFRLSLSWRISFLLLGALINLRYLYWRVTFTIHPGDVFELAMMVMLLIAEMQSIVMHLVSDFSNVRPFQRDSIPLP